MSNPIAPGMRYGLLAACGMSVWLFVGYSLGFHSRHLAVGEASDWVSAVILVLTLWRLLAHVLEAKNLYWLPVWQGALHGLYASLVAAMTYYIVFSLYLRFVNPNFPDLYLEWRVASMRAAGTPEAEVREMARVFRWSMGPVGLPISLGGFYLLLGFAASPLLTLWLNWRRKEGPKID